MESVKVEVSGKYGCFTRPEMNTHRVSYTMITPSAAKGVLQAIYAKTQEFEWRILYLWLLRVPGTTSFMTNEVQSKVNLKPKKGGAIYPGTRDDRLQRRNLILKNCCFGIEAVPVIKGQRSNKNNEKKHINRLQRRLKRGACFYRPYLGMRDYPAEFRAAESFAPVDITADLGWMPLMTPQSGEPPRLFKARLVAGCLEVPNV